jgi:hypothetical protein
MLILFSILIIIWQDGNLRLRVRFMSLEERFILSQVSINCLVDRVILLYIGKMGKVISLCSQDLVVYLILILWCQSLMRRLGWITVGTHMSLLMCGVLHCKSVRFMCLLVRRNNLSWEPGGVSRLIG